MRRNILFIYIGILLQASLFFCSCTDESIATDSSYKLRFSTDSLNFDTVFTTITSTTAKFKVYNPHNEAISIAAIKLAGGASSPFKISVMGRTSLEQSFADIELRANDSLYVFVNITINPNNQDNPVLIQDKIQFLTNGNLQEIQLQAIGQDVVILKNKQIVNDTLLSNDKPYLIYGNLSIATGKTLEIEKGSKLYFHDKAGITVNGTLKAIGTVQEPILFRGDRIDELFSKLPYDSLDGQWNGISITSESAIHQLEHVDIRSAKNGISISAKNTGNELIIKNSSLHNFTETGLLAHNAKISIENTQITNCGKTCVTIEGGEASFIHCTIANYFPTTDRKDKSLVISNYDAEKTNIALNSVSFKNSIIFGNYENEIVLNNNELTAFTVTFSNCVLTGNASTDNRYVNCSWYSKSENIFANTNVYPYNFQLTNSSVARGKADLSIANSLPTDKKGYSRIADGQPDAGAYEYIQP